ncbi:MAG TPA: dihydroneopterin aldolase [Caproiciproducens sp.]|nr:dihydroneopterin aldolase [Caproiciproducens sp.]
MDKIIIKGLKVYAYHGVNPEEKRDGQTFFLDIALFLSLRRPGGTDRLEDTVNYSKVVKTVLRVMTEEKYDLIERAAERVAEQLLTEYQSVGQVEVLLKKPQAPVNAEFDYMAVQIIRQRSDFHE